MIRKEEEEKQERKNRAATKKAETLEKIENRNLQRKITDSLGTLPRNRRILLEREIEKERRLTIKEAREELWKRWRHAKGKRKTNPNYSKKTRNETLEDKLDKIETEISKYKAELEQRQEQERRKEDRLAKKRRLERHWEMLRWIVQFMDENEDKWAELKRIRTTEEEERTKRSEWEKKTQEQKIKEIQEEERREKKERMSKKDERLKEAQHLKRSWTERRELDETMSDWEEDDEGVAGGGSPKGAFSFQNKALSVLTQEGDPPIGKKMGTLGVGTSPTPP